MHDIYVMSFTQSLEFLALKPLFQRLVLFLRNINSGQIRTRYDYAVYFLLIVLYISISAHLAFDLTLDLESWNKTITKWQGSTEVDQIWRGAPWKSSVANWFQKIGDAALPVLLDEIIYEKPCLMGCNGAGVCNHEEGLCRCRSGYNDTDCSGFDDHPCNLDPFLEDKPSRWIPSACAAQCDRRTANCYCGKKSKHPYRSMAEPCGMLRVKGRLITTNDTQNFLYGESNAAVGYCNADIDKVMDKSQRLVGTCHCAVDGRSGFLCNDVTQAYCFGGCSGHGVCYSGYCECRDGWYGIDCSIPSVAAEVSSRNNTGGTGLPPWLQVPTEPSQHGHIRRVRRKRPLIYIYDLPGQFTFHHYEGRKSKFYCVPWQYNPNNDTMWFPQLYGMEPVVLEALLASPHRTSNAEEADFFYVPVLTGCILVRADETPKMDMQTSFAASRPYLTTQFVNSTLDYIRSQFPYWNRTYGKDHIWMYPWDEGACYAPAAIWNSTMLSPWGNTMTKHNTSTTAYKGDKWDLIPKSIRGDHPCFDPDKDIVLPAWKFPSGFWLAANQKQFENRTTLFYFNGNLGPDFVRGRREHEYSMGIRQKVGKHFASVPNLRGELGSLTEPGVIVTSVATPSYGEELSSSVFCGVFPGDGFSARLEDSLLHGCIPVIIQDGIQMAWENMLNFSAFTVRLTEDQIPDMIHILKAISEERRKAMWSAVHGLWQRWTYHSVISQEYLRQKAWHGHDSLWGQESMKLDKDDAIDTLIQVLNFKLHNDPWRTKHRET